MKNTAMKKLMQHLPEEYLDEALQYHMTHAEDHSSVRQVKKPEPLRMLRLAAPVSAAACLAAVAGLGRSGDDASAGAAGSVGCQ